MIRLLADENFNGEVVRRLLNAQPDLDLIRVQDTELSGAPDPVVLEWAAQHGRIVLTHDLQIMIGFAYDRIKAGLTMPGLFVVGPYTAINDIVGDILLLLGQVAQVNGKIR
jgi:hypothetical protein